MDKFEMDASTPPMSSSRRSFSSMEYAKQSWIIILVLCVAVGDTKIVPNVQKAVYKEHTNPSPSLIPCESGWYFFKDKCYRVFDKTKGLTWTEAKAKCSAHHGSLATIPNAEIQGFLTTFLVLNARSNLWIGLNDRDSESKYIWDDGSKFDYSKWEPGEPTGRRDHKEDCVEIRYAAHGEMGSWNDMPCNYVLPYICQKEKSEQSLNRDPRFCTDENDGAWNLLNSCYHTIDEEMTWNDAENYCQTVLKGHLLSIPNSKTSIFLNYVLSSFDKEFWIGINEGTYETWTTGWPVRFSKWEDRDKEYANDSCAIMTKKKNWSSAPCIQKLPFVCEVPKEEILLPQAPKDWRCPDKSDDWVDLGGDTCYIFETRRSRKWLKANLECTKKGGNLASIHSLAETHAIHPRVIGIHEKLYIGLHRSSSNDNVFEWADGTKINYQNWKIGEPSSRNEECSELLTDEMVWNDVPCDDYKGYICSAKKVPPTYIQSHHMIDTGCPGYISWNMMLVIVFAVIAVLLVACCTVYYFKDYCRRSDEKPWKFSYLFKSKDETGASELQRLTGK